MTSGPISLLEFSDLWPYLESLSEAEIDALYQQAGSDRRYRLELCGLFVGYLLGITAFSFAIPAFYRAFHPDKSFRIFLAVAALVGIWLSVGLLRKWVQHFFYRAVFRQITFRRAVDGS